MTDNAESPHDLSREASDLRIATFRLARRMRTQRAVDSMSDGQFAVLAGLFDPRWKVEIEVEAVLS